MKRGRGEENRTSYPAIGMNQCWRIVKRGRGEGNRTPCPVYWGVVEE